MLAAKNNRSRYVTKATGVMIVGAEYSLESEVSWSRRWETVFASGSSTTGPSTCAGFHHGREAGISDTKSYADEKARADDQCAKNHVLKLCELDHGPVRESKPDRRADKSSGRRLRPSHYKNPCEIRPKAHRGRGAVSCKGAKIQAESR